MNNQLILHVQNIPMIIAFEQLSYLVLTSFFLFRVIICNYILHKERKSPNFGSRKLTCCCLCRRLYGDSSTRCQYLASRVTLPPFTRLNPTVNPSKRGSEYL